MPSEPLLVCPMCKGELEHSADVIACRTCGARFFQADPAFVNLLPDQLAAYSPTEAGWSARQEEMNAWYENLISAPSNAVKCFDNDYSPYAPIFAQLRGRVIDIGGGAGVSRHYLPNASSYVVVDPSLTWLAADWRTISQSFPCMERAPRFIRALGEYLPFPAASFDVALCMWSLNHVKNPEAIFREAHRILAPTGRFLVVLEDMPPSWPDLVVARFRRHGLRKAAWEVVQRRLGWKEWPVQSDHIPIKEWELMRWLRGRFRVRSRTWPDAYLTFDLTRTP
jgi:SAM-dependent methyltransferase